MPRTWQRAAVYLAAFIPLEENADKGWYVLEPSVHPYAEIMSDGYFQLDSVPPGKYVVIIGPNPEEAVAAMDAENPHVIEVKAGELLDIGSINVS